MGAFLPLVPAIGGGTAALPQGYGMALLKMLAALAVVVALVYIGLRFGLKRLLPRQGKRSAYIRVIDACDVEPGRGLWIVAVGDRRLLIGGSERGLSLLAELDPEDLEPRGPGAASEA